MKEVKRSMADPMGKTRRANGARFREMRSKAGLTKELAAIRLGCSYSTLANYESGRTDPTAIVLITMRRVYGCTASDLLGVP